MVVFLCVNVFLDVRENEFVKREFALTDEFE